MKTIIFADSVLDHGPADVCIDLSIQRSAAQSGQNEATSAVLSCALARSGPQWLRQFSAWMGQLNCDNNDLFWWAHTSTAKNMLSSSLGTRYIEVQAVCDIARQSKVGDVTVVGATPGQMEEIASLLCDSELRVSGAAWRWRKLTRIRRDLNTLARQFVQAGRVLICIFPYRLRHLKNAPDLCLFTYIDGAVRSGVDNYFGTLPHLLYGDEKASVAMYLAYVYKPFFKRLRQLSSTQKDGDVPYVVLFKMLRVHDLLWALCASLREWWRNAKHGLSSHRSVEYNWLLNEAFIDDLAVSDYLHHLLICRAVTRFLNEYQPKTLAYPFENKSVEKMIVIGATQAIRKPRVVGYQHTSLTPRHVTFIFEPGEAQCTPMPAKIITVGKITKEYLEEFGNYPPGIFIEGCALRQRWGKPIPRHKTKVKRMLLALSSSKAELIRSIEFCQQVVKLLPELEVGIRPHHNFPLSVLPPELALWVKKQVHNFMATSLEENLEWCTVTAYVSSTVALEAMMRGRPVINFSVGDIVSPDPVMDSIPFHWHVHTELEMVATLLKLHELDDDSYWEASAHAIAYVSRYLSPVNDSGLRAFNKAFFGENPILSG